MRESNAFGEKSTSSQRKKREELQLELRRQHTEDLLNKKRAAALNADNNVSSFEAIKSLVFSQNIEDIYKGTYECRTFISVQFNPPIQDVVDSGLVPRFVELLDPSFYSKFGTNPLASKCRFEAAWIITNIVSGNAEQTKYVVRLGAVSFLAKMAAEPDETIVDQAVWALGNIAGDGEEMRDIVLKAEVLPIVLSLIERYHSSSEHIKLFRNLVWLLSNLNRGRNPLPSEECMNSSFAAIDKIIHINDHDVVSDCAWCISYLVDASPALADQVLKSSIMKRLYSIMLSLLQHLKKEDHDQTLSKIGAMAICPIIRLLGNIVTGTEQQTDMIIQMGFLKFMSQIFYSYQNKNLPRIRKEICWLLSNVTAGSHSQIAYILESDLFMLLIDAITNYELFIRKEAAYAVSNMLFFCSKNPQYLQSLLDNKIVLAIQAYLEAVNNIPELQLLVLDSVRHALEAGEKIKQKFGTNPVIQQLIESGLVDQIEDLQDSKSNIVVQKAYNIIVTYFDGVEE